MSISSIRGLLSSYSPVSEFSPDLEKEYQLPLRNESSSDLESSADEAKFSRPKTEKADSKVIDGRLVSDAIIGLSDGMTVPFALTAGLSALGDTKVVVFGGMAELIAGAISMGLGGYLGAKSEDGWKGSRNVRRGLIGGLQMVLVGGVAAGSAMGLVKGFQLMASGGSDGGEQ
ncbi:hypothetical protein APSETT444_004012 [Aspergillus pseudonomiae]